MNRSLFLFVMLFVTACSVEFGGDGGGGPWGGPSADADPSAPWGEPVEAPDASAVEAPWSDGGPTEPWSDASVEPGVDGGAVEPADASLPPCHGDPPVAVDASAPEPGAG